MILFDLLCAQGHGFEAWFRDSESFDRLVAVGEIQCAVCGDTDVRKALMAPNISPSKRKDGRPTAQDGQPAANSESSSEPDERGDAPSLPANTSQPAAKVVQDQRGPLGGSHGLPVPEKVAEAMQVLRQVQTHIEKNFDHVGKRFAEEARKMHYGEAEKRSIYGEATKEEAAELADEGIDVNQMPWLTPRNS